MTNRTAGHHTKAGNKVVYANPGSGSQHDRTMATLCDLVLGAEYTVQDVAVYSFETRLWLKEAPGPSFNSVLFDEVK